MSDTSHLAVFEQGREAWNAWRKTLDPDDKPNLAGLDRPGFDFGGWNLDNTELFRARLAGSHFHDTSLDSAGFSEADVRECDFAGARLLNAVMMGADLRGCLLRGLHAPGILFIGAKLDGAEMDGSDFAECNFSSASLLNVNLQHSILHKCDFEGADLTGANLRGTVLRNASFVDTQVQDALFDEAEIYGVSAWNLQGTPRSQKDLLIVPADEGLITTDDLEVAQFIYLMHHNKKIRNVLDTVTGKGVLILGRFTPPERKAVLDGLRDKLRSFNLLPIVFDFDRPAGKDYTETVQTLAGMSRFVIADITSPKSTPLELEACVKQFKIPYVPIIDGSQGEQPFAMLRDLQTAFHWVLDCFSYRHPQELMDNLKIIVIDRAVEKHNQLQREKSREVRLLSLEDLLAGAAEPPGAPRRGG